MTDEVALWSDELARDPSSLVFLPLGETLRRKGQLELAQKVAARGIARHPDNAEARDLLARILVDRNDLEAAFTEWEMVRRLMPRHVGALKGMAFIRFQQGKLDEAESLLQEAQTHDEDASITAAIDTVRRSGWITAFPAAQVESAEWLDDPRMLFAGVLRDDQTAMLLDTTGMVLAGAYYSANGNDVAQEVGASLSGVSDEARRATRHLGIGAWRSIVFETEAAVVALAPSLGAGSSANGGEGLLVVAASPTTPLGLLTRSLDRCLARVSVWVSGGGAR